MASATDTAAFEHVDQLRDAALDGKVDEIDLLATLTADLLIACRAAHRMAPKNCADAVDIITQTLAQHGLLPKEPGDIANSERAAWARNALATFTVETFDGQLPKELDFAEYGEAIGNLIADLMHLGHQHGIGTDLLIENAKESFAAEIDDEPIEAAILPDGSVSKWDERLHTVGALQVEG